MTGVTDKQVWLADTARALLPAKVAVATADPAAPASGLTPDETRQIGKAIDKRQREFAAGRRAGRSALAAVGALNAEIPRAEDRSPVWPDGFTGSISHK